MRRTARTRVLSVIATIVSAAVVFGQSPGARPAFEVASVKRQTDVVSGMTFSARAATLTVVNNEVTNVIDNAYGIRRYQLIGGPDWINTDRYDIQAKAAGDATRDELMRMTQSLLEERFKLRVHRETRELPIYVLTVAKGGIRAPRSVEGACVHIDARTPRRPGETRPGCGNNLIRVNSWNATAIDMAGAAAALVGVLERNVVDKTGVTGKFDIHVEWTPDSASAGDTAGPSLVTVLADQLGLKVESARGPVDVLVIDHIERPTDD